MSDIKSKSYKAFLWDLSGKTAAQSVGFVVSVILARILSPDDFGILAMVNVVIVLSSGVADMGLGVALIQAREVTDEHYASVFWANLVLSLVLSLCLLLGAPYIGQFYERPDVVPIARVMSVLFIFNSFGNVLKLKLQRQLDFAVPTQGALIGAFVSGLVGVIAAGYGMGVWSLVIQACLMPLVANSYLFFRINWRPRLLFRWKAIRDLWRFGGRMFLASVLDNIYSTLDSIIIGKIFSPATLGYYFRAKSLNNYVIQYSSGSLANVIFPALSRMQDDPQVFKKAVLKGYHVINFVAFFLTGFFFVTGEYLILLLFGQKWSSSIPMFRLVILSGFCIPVGAILINLIKAAGNSEVFLLLEVIKKVFFTIAFAVGFFWGIQGFLLCFSFAYYLSLIANTFFAERQIGLRKGFFLNVTGRYFLITAIIALVNYYGLKNLELPRWTMLIIGGGSFSILYLVASIVWKLDGLSMIVQEVRSTSLFLKYFGSNRNEKDN